MAHLPNIRYFKNRVQKIVAAKTPVSIVMFDVDNFKLYNDTHGGEEFILCYTGNTSGEEAHHIAEDFRKKVEAYHFDGEGSQPQGTLTISLRISYSSGEKTMEQAIEEADIALYQSKKTGKNRVTLYGNSALTTSTQEG